MPVLACVHSSNQAFLLVVTSSAVNVPAMASPARCSAVSTWSCDGGIEIMMTPAWPGRPTHVQNLANTGGGHHHVELQAHHGPQSRPDLVLSSSG